jgi:hypothetical protein
VILRLAESASRGDLVKTQVLVPLPRHSDSETVGSGEREGMCVLTRDTHTPFESHCLECAGADG